MFHASNLEVRESRYTAFGLSDRECFTKTILADGLELTHSTSGARLS